MLDSAISNDLTLDQATDIGGLKTIHLDVSELEPPEPMVCILEALPKLSPGEVLCVHHRREPFPLYQKLASLGFDFKTIQQTEARYQIHIWQSRQREPSK
ncbi:DUF2249 domain-containing protein [Litoribrevibacter albus]|uniref:DUF2249 domain-containing protein n=1 Tax=Litoribrevibacter albus TaxID=1473156 RepID=A0AA37SC06_9GAMM|nr:DUF2249 domain-containing protein [Litoribrevibacter albus]GLQ31943.1 hypothetical protein GCM10007876_24220 [Litoribrevibacter albus]